MSLDCKGYQSSRCPFIIPVFLLIINSNVPSFYSQSDNEDLFYNLMAHDMKSKRRASHTRHDFRAANIQINVKKGTGSGEKKRRERETKYQSQSSDGCHFHSLAPLFFFAKKKTFLLSLTCTSRDSSPSHRFLDIIFDGPFFLSNFFLPQYFHSESQKGLSQVLITLKSILFTSLFFLRGEL